MKDEIFNTEKLSYDQITFGQSQVFIKNSNAITKGKTPRKFSDKLVILSQPTGSGTKSQFWPVFSYKLRFQKPPCRGKRRNLLLNCLVSGSPIMLKEDELK